MDANSTLSNWTDWGISDYADDDVSPEEHDALKNSLNLAAMILYTLIFLLGVPGNAAVIWIVGFRMRRRPNTVWFLSLSAADLVCCLSLPFMVTQLALSYRWPFGSFLCKVLPSATIFSMFASVFLLMGISMDRCLVTLHPVWARNRRTATHVALACGLAWALAILMSLPSSLYRQTVHLMSDVYCTNNFDGAPANTHHVIEVTRFIFGFLLPFLVIGACNVLLLLRVRDSRIRQPRKVYRLVLLVVLGFFLCWLPYHLVGLLLLTDRELQWRSRLQTADPLITTLAYLNSCLNPFLYVFAGGGFREQLRRSLRDIFEGAFEEEEAASNQQGKSKCATLSVELAA
ncbi:C3a anaphylatoxin chemotactic receptor-like [Scyliorhinus canicula]|uniref:C3a anaphylatoxin chemotactic receptor-like n=1 Tax=Scyliorhinus canicula TaxID=7830 RepID=UPI0018F27B83|nr:C3a anaphylatoxin chemotactic receptor-like [Scyliorhinus canicula]XP_038637380.1 C3a anaphylatoxin chemotactic receptor-like [Scyliorhinus canicula]XP_038637382.1 C3a anaphylatoxin chemotactic receptor-like [Scyliorhinus canicula]